MEQTHIIHKLNIDIDVPDLTTARHIYQNFSGIWNEKILPELEQRLNKTIANEKSFRFDQLNIQLITDNADQIEEVLSIKLAGELLHFSKNSLLPADVKKPNQQNLDLKIETANEDDNTALLTDPNETIINAFLYFLQYGQLPWYVTSQTSWAGEAEIRRAFSSYTEKYRPQLVKLVSEDHRVIKRLLLQFTPEFCIFIVSEITGIEQNKIIEIIENKEENELVQVLRQLFRVISDNTSKIEGNNFSFEELETELKKQAILEKEVEENLILTSETPALAATKDKKEEDPMEVAQDELYIQYGGLILLHPFLQYFFKQFNLITDDGFINEEAKETGIHLLYYLATGNENPYEHELVFIKHLCDWPQQLPLHRFVTLTDEMKNEAENMLAAVIRHWKILKTTSPGGLRESFLQRKGKLILSGQQHKLLLEKSGIDILLEHIPWNHSIISLPWMKKILYAEW
jgi:hypothetical protein